MEKLKEENMMNIPNTLTVIRILLLPAVVWAFLTGRRSASLFLYLAAMATDVLDGLIARKFNRITSLGKLLDPLADKLSLITLISVFSIRGEIPGFILIWILFKEILMIAGGAVALRRGIVVSARPIGKVTTVAFVISFILRFLRIYLASDIMLGISLLLSAAALIWYSADLFKSLKSMKGHS